jgi:hypothetical protein
MTNLSRLLKVSNQKLNTSLRKLQKLTKPWRKSSKFLMSIPL